MNPKVPRGTARRIRRMYLRAATPLSEVSDAVHKHSLPHEYDDDCICIHCGFDSAEAWHLRHSIPSEARMPREYYEVYCERRRSKEFLAFGPLGRRL